KLCILPPTGAPPTFHWGSALDHSVGSMAPGRSLGHSQAPEQLQQNLHLSRIKARNRSLLRPDDCPQCPLVQLPAFASSLKRVLTAVVRVAVALDIPIPLQSIDHV